MAGFKFLPNTGVRYGGQDFGPGELFEMPEQDRPLAERLQADGSGRVINEGEAFPREAAHACPFKECGQRFNSRTAAVEHSREEHPRFYADYLAAEPTEALPAGEILEVPPAKEVLKEKERVDEMMAAADESGPTVPEAADPEFPHAEASPEPERKRKRKE